MTCHGQTLAEIITRSVMRALQERFMDIRQPCNLTRRHFLAQNSLGASAA